MQKDEPVKIGNPALHVHSNLAPLSIGPVKTVLVHVSCPVLPHAVPCPNPLVRSLYFSLKSYLLLLLVIEHCTKCQMVHLICKGPTDLGCDECICCYDAIHPPEEWGRSVSPTPLVTPNTPSHWLTVELPIASESPDGKPPIHLSFQY